MSPTLSSLVRPRSLRALGLGLLALLGLVLVSPGCATTGLAESWIDPSLTELPHFRKLFVAYQGADATAQRHAEDELAKHLKEVEVVKCYELLPTAGTLDAQAVKDAVRSAGCDGALVLRLVRVEQELSVSPRAYPAPYHSFNGYWGWGQPYADVYTDEIVHVETTLYSLADDRLLYTARSETFNPGSTASLIDEIYRAVAADLKAKGLRR